MKTKLIYPMVVVLFAACGRGGSSAHGNAAQQQYETVQEGSAAGVTSTISGPGETLPPMTGTNVDSTNAFALNPGAAPVQQAAVSAPPAAQPYSGTPMTASPSSEPRPMTPGIAAVAMKQPLRSQQPEAKPAEPAPAEAEPAPAVEAGPAAEPDTPTTTAEKPKQEDAPPAEDTSTPPAEEPPPPPPPM